MSHNIYRDGHVHVQREECSTCIFRKGNVMHLHAGRVRNMVDEAIAAESCIVCHQTLDGDGAVCRGFYDRYQTPPLQIAELLGVVREVDPC